MFIDGPSDSVQIPIMDEESTSVFVKEESSTIVEEEITKAPEINPAIMLKLNKVQSPFGRRLYQPLIFKLVDGKEIVGTVESIEENNVYINVDDNEKNVVTVSANEILDLMWRGKSLPET